ncbi:hypothetical protein K2Z83_21055 [Oscillochloris sp. ZM17-4]|uniref:hypothetical protein n=1 Tax=Oscillochloris sp. ZM17-4 TaxID=2866714 RepID=UPI001C73CA4B|nr:hypothetical protein [Oscillochloris sp. ZM17-4]MBX0330161.1 hypothetical protein [Oscillochloris sp. ZM17-4]
MAMLAAGVLFVVFHRHGFDDPYITYRYSANLAAGKGFVYNSGVAVLSTTAPLYALLLAPAAALGIDLPLFSNLVSCLSLGAGGLALWRLGLAWEEPLAGVASAALYTLFPLLITMIGAETSFALGLVLWAFVAASASRWPAVAVLLGLATVVRADTVLVGIVLGVGLLAGRGRARPWWSGLPWGSAAIYTLLVAPWLLFAQAYFGSPVPVTLAAKRHQALIVGSRSFGQGLIDKLGELWALPAYRLLLILALIGIGYALLRRRAALGLLGWVALYSLAYVMLGVTSYFWYYGPVFLGVTAAAGLGVAGVAAGLRRLVAPQVAGGAGLALLAVLLVAQIGSLVSLESRLDPRLLVYRQVGEWLRANTPADASVGTLEVGVIGYYSQRTMIDFAGLIQPEAAAQFDAQHGYLEVARWSMERYRPQYLALREAALPLLASSPDLARRCVSVAAFSSPSDPDPMQIYRCDWDMP